jgi:hypothetical protein
MLNSAGVSTRITVGWMPPETGAVRYVIAWRRDDENWKSDSTNQPGYDIDDVPIGIYTIRAIAVNALGRESQYVEIEHEVDESATAPDVQNLRLDPDFDGPDCPITWDAMPGAAQYQVKVFDDADNLLREAWVTVNAYMYTYALNLADDGSRRLLCFEAVAYTLSGHSANPASLAASNPAPATPQGVMVEAGPGQIGIAAVRPADTDLVGMLVWIGPSADVPLDAAHLVYQGSDNAYMKTGLAPGVSMYFRLAFYDRFGTSGLISQPASRAHCMRQAAYWWSMNDSPDDIGGEMAVFLNTEDLDRRGLWGWNGEEWIFTHDGANLIANSVSAAQINVEELSAISGNLGTITAGNFTLNALGFIKGGAMSWTSSGSVSGSVGSASVSFSGTTGATSPSATATFMGNMHDHTVGIGYGGAHYHQITIPNATASAAGKVSLGLTGFQLVFLGTHTISVAGGDQDLTFRLALLGAKR